MDLLNKNVNIINIFIILDDRHHQTTRIITIPIIIIIITTSLSSSLLSLCFLFFELFRVPRSLEFEPVPDDTDHHDDHEDQEVGLNYIDIVIIMIFIMVKMMA